MAEFIGNLLQGVQSGSTIAERMNRIKQAQEELKLEKERQKAQAELSKLQAQSLSDEMTHKRTLWDLEQEKRTHLNEMAQGLMEQGGQGGGLPMGAAPTQTPNIAQAISRIGGAGGGLPGAGPNFGIAPKPAAGGIGMAPIAGASQAPPQATPALNLPALLQRLQGPRPQTPMGMLDPLAKAMSMQQGPAQESAPPSPPMTSPAPAHPAFTYSPEEQAKMAMHDKLVPVAELKGTTPDDEFGTFWKSLAPATRLFFQASLAADPNDPMVMAVYANWAKKQVDKNSTVLTEGDLPIMQEAFPNYPWEVGMKVSKATMQGATNRAGKAYEVTTTVGGKPLFQAKDESKAAAKKVWVSAEMASRYGGIQPGAYDAAVLSGLVQMRGQDQRDAAAKASLGMQRERLALSKQDLELRRRNVQSLISNRGTGKPVDPVKFITAKRELFSSIGAAQTRYQTMQQNAGLMTKEGTPERAEEDRQLKEAGENLASLIAMKQQLLTLEKTPTPARATGGGGGSKGRGLTDAEALAKVQRMLHPGG
jgi:hypothetical protein